MSQRKRFFGGLGLVGRLGFPASATATRDGAPCDSALPAGNGPAADSHSRRMLLTGAARLTAGAALTTVALDPLPALARAAHRSHAASHGAHSHIHRARHHEGGAHVHSSTLSDRAMRNAEAASRRPLSDDRRALAFVHLHTGEKLNVTYWSGGRYLPTALEDIDALLRDWRTDEIKAMDPKLLDLLFQLKHRLRNEDAYRVICGYRCPKTNAMLAAHTDGVAARSLHMDGKAIDIDVASRPLNRIREAAVSLRLGGVGYYPRSHFVHVDTGRIRQWV